MTGWERVSSLAKSTWITLITLLHILIYPNPQPSHLHKTISSLSIPNIKFLLFHLLLLPLILFRLGEAQSPNTINTEPKKMIKNMKQFNQLQHSSPLLLVLITLIFTTTLAQSPASSPPAPSALAESPTTASSPTPSAPSATGRTNLVSILQKAGKFSIMIRLLRSTHFIDQLNSLITTTNQGVTFFAPPDSAFSRLPSGTINSFTDQQKTQLVQFHALPTYVPILQFQTLSNPVQTQAGNSVNSKFPLNITTSGTSVSMTTGTVKARVTRTIYTDGSLAVYQVDQVLLPMQFHVSLLPPALAPSVPEKAKSATSTSSGNASVRITKYTGVSFAVAVIAVIAAIAL